MRRNHSNQECAPYRSETRVSKVKLGENGKSAVFLNKQRQSFFVTRVDGGLVHNECSADFVVTKPSVGDLIVELKGKEVGRACEQVMATVELLRKCDRSRGPVAGLVVCTRRPATDTKSQRLQNGFLRLYHSRLRICEGNKEYEFESFFAGRPGVAGK